MWKVDVSGVFSFSDGVDPAQAVLFSADPGADYARPLWDVFRGKTVYAEEILSYTRDETAYLEPHARAALKLLESSDGFDNRRITVGERKRDGTKRRKGTYPKGTVITFDDSDQ